MGNGGLSGNYSGPPFCEATPTLEEMDPRGTSLKYCDHCGAKFSFFFKKVNNIVVLIFSFLIQE